MVAGSQSPGSCSSLTEKEALEKGNLTTLNHTDYTKSAYVSACTCNSRTWKTVIVFKIEIKIENKITKKGIKNGKRVDHLLLKYKEIK